MIPREIFDEPAVQRWFHHEGAPTFEGPLRDFARAPQRLRQLRAIVMLVFHVTEQQLDNRQRGKAPIAFARQVAMYLAHIACGLSLTEVGRYFGRDRTTVAHACRLVEDWREDPDLDFSLDLMEGALLRLWSLTEEGCL